jgi:DNA mismatch endonuclease (patch repair protein)
MDIVSPETRSRMMSGIRAKNTTPEVVVRRLLHDAGFRFRLHRKDLPGRPDIVLAKYRSIIYVHGCFWHMHEGCRYFKIPSSRVEFWTEKLLSNRERDRLNIAAAIALGWRVMVVWECATRSKEDWPMLQQEMVNWLLGHSDRAAIPAPLHS